MSPIDDEPRPILPPQATTRANFPGNGDLELPKPRFLPDVGFSEALGARRSAISGRVSQRQLGDLLFHVMRERCRGPGRFGVPWVGRASPSAGGLHVLSILCIPVEENDPVGVYDPSSHALELVEDSAPLRNANSASVNSLCSAVGGTTLQFIADIEFLESCYENSASLLWRDSGALAMTICMVATSLGMTSVVLGRVGSTLLDGVNFSDRFVGGGAVHLGGGYLRQ